MASKGLSPYLLPELGQLVGEYEGAHFRHKGVFSVWTRQYSGTDDIDKGDPYHGVELKATSGLWQVKLGPNTYFRVPSEHMVPACRALILYNQSLIDPEKELTPTLAMDLKFTDDNLYEAFEKSEVVICSDGSLFLLVWWTDYHYFPLMVHKKKRSLFFLFSIKMKIF